MKYEKDFQNDKKNSKVIIYHRTNCIVIVYKKKK